jgi:hypothetical protein
MKWARLAAYRKEIASDELNKVVDLITTASAAPIVFQILSNDPLISTDGVSEYNRENV